MPYRRSYRKRPYRRRRPYVGRRTQRIRSLAGQKPVTSIERLAGYAGQVGRVARTVSMMAGLINSEAKNFDSAPSGPVSSAGTFISALSAIAQGDDFNQRNGRSILLKALSCKLGIVRDPTATNTATLGWAIIRDQRPDEATLGTWSTVFVNTTPYAHINRQEHSGRFVIIKRGTQVISDDFEVKNLNFYVSLKGLHIKYDGTAATNYDQGPLYLIATSDVITTPPSITGHVRLTYYDN